MLTIWHNPRCRKSRETLALIEAAGVDVKIRKYLEDTPDTTEVALALTQLGFEDPRKLMRVGEKIYKAMDLKSVQSASVLIESMAENPILIERPIVFGENQAVLGRPPEAVKVLL